MQRVIEDSLEKPSKYCKDIPKGMENAIMKGMAALQKNRYQNLKEFCEALYSDFEDAGEEKKKPVSKSDGTLKSVNEEKEKDVYKRQVHHCFQRKIQIKRYEKHHKSYIKY